MKALYILWPDYGYILRAIESGIDTLIVAMYNPRPDMRQKTEFGTYQEIVDILRHFKGSKTKVILMPTWYNPWYPNPGKALYYNNRYYRETPCPLDKNYIDWVLEYPVKLYRKNLCNGIFIDFEDYNLESNNRVAYFRDYDKIKCNCKSCKKLSNNEQRAILYYNINKKLDPVYKQMLGQYTYPEENALRSFKYWVNGLTYYKYNFLKIWFAIRKSKNTKVICGQWVEQHSEKESIKWLKKVGKSVFSDGYWLYPQMRMSRNCYWRKYPNESWSKYSIGDLKHINLLSDDYFKKLKKVNEKIDRYKDHWWFKFKRRIFR